MEMQTPGGPMQMWFTGGYRDVVQDERLVHTESMSDENGNEVRVELDDVGGRTKMVMTHVGVPADSPGAAGWTMAFDRLAAHVEARSDG